MKRLCFVSIFGLFLVLYGCSGLGKDDSTGSLQSFLLSYTPYYMDVSPKRGVVGREGGEVVIRVCMSDTLRNGDPVPFTLKGELFFDGIDGSGDDYLEPFALGIPFVYLKERKQINDYEVSYTYIKEYVVRMHELHQEWPSFVGKSKPEYMEQTLKLFKEKYNSIENYLKLLGFKKSEIKKLQSKLLD